MGEQSSKRTLNILSGALPTDDPMVIEEVSLPVESAVFERYAGAADEVESSLCCPVDYDGIDLSHIPDEVIAKDYGCGNPAPYIKQGDVVLDLGSGAGKICFAAAKIVGEHGRVIGVDCNSEMLAVARKNQPLVAKRLGFDNVGFRFGMIQDLQLDFESTINRLDAKSLTQPAQLLELKTIEQELRAEQPMIASQSIDCVVSNCVLNLVRTEDRVQLFNEVFRVLKVGGRAAISDIVCDEAVPTHLQNDPKLWSGCISGAFQESAFVQAFVDAGFTGVKIVSYQEEPWQVVEGIEFRSMTVLAEKPPVDQPLDKGHSLIYRGPHAEIVDDSGHRFRRGERTAVCEMTFNAVKESDRSDEFILVEPQNLADAMACDCTVARVRPASESKGGRHRASVDPGSDCCGPTGDCC